MVREVFEQVELGDDADRPIAPDGDQRVGPARQQRERAVECGRDIDERKRPVHDLTDGPLHGGRVAKRPVQEALLGDRTDEPAQGVAVGLLGDRQLADPVFLEDRDRIADPPGRPGDDEIGQRTRMVSVCLLYTSPSPRDA